MPDAFSDIAKVTRSHIPAANVPARIDVPKIRGHDATSRVLEHGANVHSGSDVVARPTAPARKRGRPIGSMDSRPRKKASSAQNNPLIIDVNNPSHENIPDYGYVQETSLGDSSMSEPIPENVEISVNYTSVHGT